VLGLAVVLASNAFGQTTLDVPSQQPQEGSYYSPAPRVSPAPQPRPPEDEENTLQVPSNQPAPPPPSYNQPPPPYAQTPPPDPAAAAAAAAAAVTSLLLNQPQYGQPPLQSPPPSSAPPPANPMTMQSAPSLPSIFRGCWEAQVDSVDELEPLPGGHKVGYWTPKTYRLCYKRVGEGPFALTLTEAGVTPNMQITNVRSRINPVATDGRTRAKLRS